VILKAPWNKDQVKSLNAFQNYSIFHPFTCPNWADREHPKIGILTAVRDGWFCRQCDYTQDWAHDWMANWKWKEGDLEIEKLFFMENNEFKR
jgi:hypothetical protein